MNEKAVDRGDEHYEPPAAEDLDASAGPVTTAPTVIVTS
jgi:hypothetical protein